MIEDAFLDGAGIDKIPHKESSKPSKTTKAKKKSEKSKKERAPIVMCGGIKHVGFKDKPTKQRKSLKVGLGFKYDPLEEVSIMRAKRSASEFMAEYGKGQVEAGRILDDITKYIQ